MRRKCGWLAAIEWGQRRKRQAEAAADEVRMAEEALAAARANYDRALREAVIEQRHEAEEGSPEAKRLRRETAVMQLVDGCEAPLDRVIRNGRPDLEMHQAAEGKVRAAVAMACVSVMAEERLSRWWRNDIAAAELLERIRENDELGRLEEAADAKTNGD